MADDELIALAALRARLAEFTQALRHYRRERRPWQIAQAKRPARRHSQNALSYLRSMSEPRMHDFQKQLEVLCRDFRATGEGYIYYEAFEALLNVYPEGVDYLIALFGAEDQEAFKEALARLIITFRPFAPAIAYVRDVCRWPQEDFEDYEGYLEWVRQGKPQD